MIEQTLQHAVAAALKELYNYDCTPESVVLQTTKKEFAGDYTVVVFPYVKTARKAPEQVAGDLGEAVKEKVPEVAGYNVVKGFLNISVADGYWAGFVGDVLGNYRFGLKAADPCAKPVVVEYSSPNTNKPLHLGHIRNNLLGWSVSQLLTANGANVK